MGAIVLFGSDQLDHMLAGAELLRAAALAIVCGAGAAAYFVLAWACGAADRAAVANLAKRPLDRLRRRRDKP
jgi:hypothetical protein